ncbi:hypothetical protein HOK00_01170 [bacterium]|jgi:hypothetical protein|nr:hypothetical protein [bacterium]
MKTNTKLTIMCDYCADGLWLDGYAITIKDLPQKVHFLEDKINKWQQQFEILMKPFLRDDNFKEKFYQQTQMKKFIKEGYKISKLLRKKLPGRYVVEYFNELDSKRILIKNSLNNLKKLKICN